LDQTLTQKYSNDRMDEPAQSQDATAANAGILESHGISLNVPIEEGERPPTVRHMYHLTLIWLESCDWTDIA